MLVPHGREDAEFGEGRLAADQVEDLLVFVGLEPVGGNEVGGDLGFVRNGHAATSSKMLSNSARPSVPPCAASIRFSGCGIMPRTFFCVVEDAGDVMDRTVGIGAHGIAEGDLVLVLDAGERFGVGVVIAVHVGDRAADHLPGAIAGGEGRAGIDHFEPDLAADEADRGVAHQHAGQEARFGQDLEAVADPENEDAAFGGAADVVHDRRPRRDGAGSQVVAIGKAAGQDDEIGLAAAWFACARRCRALGPKSWSRRRSCRGRGSSRETGRWRFACAHRTGARPLSAAEDARCN